MLSSSGIKLEIIKNMKHFKLFVIGKLLRLLHIIKFK